MHVIKISKYATIKGSSIMRNFQIFQVTNIGYSVKNVQIHGGHARRRPRNQVTFGTRNQEGKSMKRRRIGSKILGFENRIMISLVL